MKLITSRLLRRDSLCPFLQAPTAAKHTHSLMQCILLLHPV
jgi:hypothetical protein